MKIAIIGYGKMGRMIERIAQERGHEIVCRIDADNTSDFNTDAFRSADVAIEFSTPDSASAGVLHCFAADIPVVCGTTGWGNDLKSVEKLVEEGKGTLFYSSNYSVGVNIFRAINSYLARIMSEYGDYTPRMKETHHIHKLDHPSGTAITLAEEIVEGCSRIEGWTEVEMNAEAPLATVGVEHERRGEVAGIHTVVWDSPVDTISLTHSAKGREGFATGAVMAAEWLADKPQGLYGMADMLHFRNALL